MKQNNILILILSLLFISSCNQSNNGKYIELFGENINLKGDPKQQVLTQYINGDVDFVYPFNTMVSMSVILEVPAIYHCFILEQIGDKKQLSYIKIDDGMKYNYIPEYDSLEYDLNISVKDEYNGKLPSSKFDSIPLFREKSEEYNKLISSCDDVQEFTDFYNNSLFFQCDTSIINNEYKQEKLNQLLGIILIRFIENVGDGNVFYFNKGFRIFHGSASSYSLQGIIEQEVFESYLSYRKNSINVYNKEILDFHSKSRNVKIHEGRLQRYIYYSKTFSLYQKHIVDDIDNKTEDIYKFYDDGYIIYYYAEFYLFAIKLNIDNNKLSIERNFINPQFLLPPKFINYQ